MAFYRTHLCVFVVLVTLAKATLFTYEKPGDTNPCIMVDIDFVVEFTASQNGSVVATATRDTSDPSDITVSGSCGEITAVMNLRFKSGSNWILNFRHFENGSADLDKLVQFVPTEMFGDNVTETNIVSMDDPGYTDLLNSSLSYVCSSLDTAVYIPVSTVPREYNYSVTANISYIHAQAYNLKDGKFSPQVECPQDVPTTSSPATTATTTPESTSTPSTNTTGAANTTIPTDTTTPSSSSNTTKPVETTSVSPTSTQKPGPPVNEYVVKGDNLTCIVFQVGMAAKIKYQANEGNNVVTKTTTVEVPADAKSTGSCGDKDAKQQTLTIDFDEGWSVGVTFSKKDSFNTIEEEIRLGDTQEAVAYEITNVTLTYVIDEKKFPDSVLDPGTVQVVVPASAEPNFPKKSAAKGYYKCKGNIDLKLTDDVTVVADELEFKAFNDDNDDTFVGDAEECKSDSSSDDDVPIIVGCVVGGLVVLCIIIFIFLRCRGSKNSYSNI